MRKAVEGGGSGEKGIEEGQSMASRQPLAS